MELEVGRLKIYLSYNWDSFMYPPHKELLTKPYSVYFEMLCYVISHFPFDEDGDMG